MKTKKHPVLVGISVFLTLSLVTNLSVFLGRFSEESVTFDIGETEMLNSLKYGYYSELLERSYGIDEKLLESNATAQECYYIGQYYESAVLYKAYLTFDQEKAAFYQQKMESNGKLVVELSYALEDIKDILQISG